MVMYFLGIPDPEVTHVFLATLNAYLKVCIAVDLAQFLGGDSTLTMQAVDILANYML